MKITLNLTKDEKQWLKEVVHYGGEVTSFMLREQYLKKDKDWAKIQFALYKKRLFS